MNNKYKVRLSTDVHFNWSTPAGAKPTAQGVIKMEHGNSSVIVWLGPIHEIKSHDAEAETTEAYRETTDRLAKVFKALFASELP